MEALFKKMLNQVDDFMIAILSKDEKRVKSAYLKLTNTRTKVQKFYREQLQKDRVEVPKLTNRGHNLIKAQKPKIDWDSFDRMMTYERSDKH